MRIVIALGCNAVLKRGTKIGAEAQAHGIRSAAAQLAKVAEGNDLVIVHGKDHRAGLLASHDCEVHAANGLHHTIQEAESDARLDYQLELELHNHLPKARPCATLLPMIQVDAADPAFKHPDKPIGAGFSGEHALRAARAKGWTVAYDGVGYRRVVPSPRPMRVVHLTPLRRLIDEGTVVICAGGGGIPVVAAADGGLHGVEAIVDKHHSAALVAEAIEADLFVIATDVAGVFLDWGTANSKLLRHGRPGALREFPFCAASMGPKVEAASRFAERTGRRAAIGALSDIAELIDGTAGTTISCEHVDPRRVPGGSIVC